MCVAPRIIKNISTGERVLGVTSVDDELFVLLKRDVDQVAVYSINDYQLLRHLSVPGLKPSNDNDNDMTSCVRHKCLYMSDFDNSCIHRYDLRSRAIIKWRVPGSPGGLSVTPSCNLLVTCRGETDKLVELSADSGQCVREITLQSDIENVVYAWHSVQLTTGQYVVSHGFDDSFFYHLSVVGDDGKVTLTGSYQLGSSGERNNCQCHLAVDKDSQFIFVADFDMGRVELLSPTLEFVRYVIKNIYCVKSFRRLLILPCRLHLHQPTRRLFVGQFDGDVVVIEL